MDQPRGLGRRRRGVPQRPGPGENNEHSAPTASRVAVDAMGGDHAPAEIVRGAVRAARDSAVPLVLVGRRTELLAHLAAEGADREIPVVHAEDALAMHEGALASWRRPRSSVAVACRMIRNGEASALVSAGSTGGVVATSTVRLRTLPGVLRPALAVDLPTRPVPTVLLDAGATADAKPEMLVQYAALGSAYARTAHGVARPRVGVLTIGSEPGKGNKLARKTSELLTATAEDTPLFDYSGNVEGHDLLNGRVDVAVTDGFTGNVALKAIEGAAQFLFDDLRALSTSGPRARLGALLLAKPLRDMHRKLADDSAGGAVLLGLNGTVVIAHGASECEAVAAACIRAHALASGRIVEQAQQGVHTSGRSALRSHRTRRS